MKNRVDWGSHRFVSSVPTQGANNPTVRLVRGLLAASVAIRKKARATGIHTPLIALTVHAMKGDREKYLRAGMDGYVPKPIRRQELFDTIGQLVSKTLPT